MRLAIFGLLALAACPPPQPAPIPPDASDASPPLPADASPVVDAGDVCARACAVLRDASCPEGARSNCESACRADQTLGAASQLHADCIVDAGPSRGALAFCNVRCR